MAVTPEDVRAVLTTPLSDAQLEAIIADVELMAEACLAKIQGEARRDAIVKYLVAHFAVQNSTGAGAGVLASQKVGDASESYASGFLGKNLRSTTYGQMALNLDPCGCLIRLGREKALIRKV